MGEKILKKGTWFILFMVKYTEINDWTRNRGKLKAQISYRRGIMWWVLDRNVELRTSSRQTRGQDGILMCVTTCTMSSTDLSISRLHTSYRQHKHVQKKNAKSLFSWGSSAGAQTSCFLFTLAITRFEPNDNAVCKPLHWNTPRTQQQEKPLHVQEDLRNYCNVPQVKADDCLRDDLQRVALGWADRTHAGHLSKRTHLNQTFVF